MSKPVPIDPNPWMTRKQAQQYLGLSESKVDYMVVSLGRFPRRVPGKIRATAMKLPGSKRVMPRLLKSDVYAILPRPDGIQAAEPDFESEAA